jgi:hypothetical protein
MIIANWIRKSGLSEENSKDFQSFYAVAFPGRKQFAFAFNVSSRTALEYNTKP